MPFDNLIIDNWNKVWVFPLFRNIFGGFDRKTVSSRGPSCPNIDKYCTPEITRNVHWWHVTEMRNKTYTYTSTSYEDDFRDRLRFFPLRGKPASVEAWWGVLCFVRKLTSVSDQTQGSGRVRISGILVQQFTKTCWIKTSWEVKSFHKSVDIGLFESSESILVTFTKETNKKHFLLQFVLLNRWRICPPILVWYCGIYVFSQSYLLVQSPVWWTWQTNVI